MNEDIIGVIERIIFKNNDNGYYVVSVKVNSTGKNCVVVGNHVKLHEGTTMKFSGKWVANSKYGNQFKAEKIQEIEPETKEAIEKYLSSSFFKGIGPSIAKKIVNRFGDKTIEVLKKNIERLTEIKGISKKKMQSIKNAWETNSEINEIMLFLQAYNISTLFAVKIYEFYGIDCVNKIRENPYQLSDDIQGIGFKYADNIAIDLGFQVDGIERLSAAIKYVLAQNENNGHCYLTYEQVVSNVTSLIGINVKNKILDIIEMLADNHQIKKIQKHQETIYYSLKIFYNEKYCAEKINLLKTNSIHIKEKTIKKWEDSILNEEIKLTEKQYKYSIKIAKGGVSILTGGPGCGKTTTLKQLIMLLEEAEIEYVLASPTGRAAKRMEELIERESSTIHRLLGWDHANKMFVHNETNQLKYKFFIIDESSMIDINLASAMLKAIPNDASVLFIGDADQLPPVGPGNLLKDMIKSNTLPVFVLDEIFRQGKDSLIIKYAHQINRGEEPDFQTPLINPSIWEDKTDCMIIDSETYNPYKNYEDYPDWSSLHYGIDEIGMITKLYSETIKKYHKEIKEIQILSPMNIGEIGSININNIIQDTINPKDINKNEITVRKTILREGDRVIQTVNNYDLGVFNGTIGKIVEINTDLKQCKVKFDKDLIVEYKKEQLMELKLSYCITIHKSQGSEFQSVIIPITNQHFPMLYRNLLYTGVTRAKEFCILVGQRGAISHAIKNKNPMQRQTSLVEFLQK